MYVAPALGGRLDFHLLPRNALLAGPASGWDQRPVGPDGRNGVLVSGTADSGRAQVQDEGQVREEKIRLCGELHFFVGGGDCSLRA